MVHTETYFKTEMLTKLTWSSYAHGYCIYHHSVCQAHEHLLCVSQNKHILYTK